LPIAARCESIDSFEQEINGDPSGPQPFSLTIISLILARAVKRPDFEALAEKWLVAVTPHGHYREETKATLNSLRAIHFATPNK
ncbi:MAG: hypothetical protein ABW190_04725, partial [Rhizobacter sp.]